MKPHPLSGLRHVLIIGSEVRDAAAVFRRFAPLLRRHELELHRVPAGTDPLQLLRTTSFDLLVVSCGLSQLSLEDLVRAARAVDSASRHSAILLLTDGDADVEVGRMVGRGINRVISLESSDAELQHALSDLLNVAPRVALRAPLRLSVQTGPEPETVTAEIDNLSISGMLVRGGSGCERGDRIGFEIDLPDQDEPVRGVAEVVRRADQRREWVEGFAARFLAFRGVGRQRLEAFILEHGTRRVEGGP